MQRIDPLFCLTTRKCIPKGGKRSFIVLFLTAATFLGTLSNAAPQPPPIPEYEPSAEELHCPAPAANQLVRCCTRFINVTTEVAWEASNHWMEARRSDRMVNRNRGGCTTMTHWNETTPQPASWARAVRFCGLPSGWSSGWDLGHGINEINMRCQDRMENGRTLYTGGTAWLRDSLLPSDNFLNLTNPLRTPYVLLGRRGSQPVDPPENSTRSLPSDLMDDPNGEIFTVRRPQIQSSHGSFNPVTWNV